MNGTAEVWNAGDELEASSVNGDVKASLSNAGQHPVKLSTVNGSAALAISATANAHVVASTVHGDIHSDLPLQVEKSRYAPEQTWTATWAPVERPLSWRR